MQDIKTRPLTIGDKMATTTCAKEELKEPQDSCSHEEWDDVREWDPEYFSQGIGKKGSFAYKGKKCKKCGFFIPRRPGNKFLICYNCGGDMEFKVILPEPDQNGHTKIYACKNCGHEAGAIGVIRAQE